MSEAERRTRKPTGSIGPVVMNPQDESAEFQAIQWPAEKADVEHHIVRFVVAGLRAGGTNFYALSGDPVPNAEDDFDFTLPTESGTEYLELMEVAALDHVAGSYSAGPASYNHGERADYVYSKVMAKAKKYGSRGAPIHLLLYTTDWRFRLRPGVLALLGFAFARREHFFKTILYFVPDDETHGEAKVLYPVDAATWATFDEQASRNRRTYLADPSQLRVSPDGSVEMPLGEPGAQERGGEEENRRQ